MDGGEAEVPPGGRRGLSLRGARGGGCPRPCWVVGAPFGRLFLSTGRQFLLGAAEAWCSAARNPIAAGLPRGVYWVVRGLWARALRLRGRLRCCAGVDRSDMAAVAKGTRNPTRLATRRRIFVPLGAREPSRADRGPAGADGPGLVPHSR